MTEHDRTLFDFIQTHSNILESIYIHLIRLNHAGTHLSILGLVLLYLILSKAWIRSWARNVEKPSCLCKKINS